MNLYKKGHTFFMFVYLLMRFLLFSHSVLSHLCNLMAAAHQISLSFISWNLLKLRSIESVMPSKHLILCCPLLLLPSIFPIIRIFSNELALLMWWPKYWSFSFSISPSFPLGLTGVTSLLSKRIMSRSITTIEKHQFFDALPSP